MPVISVPRSLRGKLGDDASDDLVVLINQATAETRDNIIELSAEKFERRITEEASRLDKRITEEASRLDKRITEEASRLDKRITEEVSKLEQRISETRADLIRWMFLFWLGQVATMTAIMAGLLRFIR